MRSLIQLYSLVLEKIIPTECLSICNIIDKFYAEKTISGAEYFVLKQHFKEIPRPSDADQDSEFYWPLDETGRKRRIQLIEEILKKLKNEGS